MVYYFSYHPGHALVFALICSAITVYLFCYAGPRIGGVSDSSSRDHYARNLRYAPRDYQF